MVTELSLPLDPHLDPCCAPLGDYGEMTNFSTLPKSLVAMFQILMTNNWNDILYTAMDGQGHAVAIFLIAFYILSVLVMLNIFTSIVLQSINKREGEALLPKHVGAHKVRMQGTTYTLDRKGTRRGTSCFTLTLTLFGTRRTPRASILYAYWAQITMVLR